METTTIETEAHRNGQRFAWAYARSYGYDAAVAAVATLRGRETQAYIDGMREALDLPVTPACVVDLGACRKARRESEVEQ